MASRRLVPASVREALLGIPSDIASLERNYLLADDDLDLIGTRRRPENRLGLALHIALLRHPGQGWLDDTDPPTPLVAWLAEQIKRAPFQRWPATAPGDATRIRITDQLWAVHAFTGILDAFTDLRFVPASTTMRTAMDAWHSRAAFDQPDDWSASWRERRAVSDAQLSWASASCLPSRETYMPWSGSV